MTKNTYVYLALNGFSAIQRGHFYDADTFLIIRDLVFTQMHSLTQNQIIVSPSRDSDGQGHRLSIVIAKFSSTCRQKTNWELRWIDNISILPDCQIPFCRAIFKRMIDRDNNKKKLCQVWPNFYYRMIIFDSNNHLDQDLRFLTYGLSSPFWKRTRWHIIHQKARHDYWVVVTL